MRCHSYVGAALRLPDMERGRPRGCFSIPEHHRAGPTVLLTRVIGPALLFLILCVVASPSSAAPWNDTALVVGNGTAGPYFLTGRPLLADSVCVCRSDGGVVPELGWTLDHDPGRVVFTRALAPGDSVLVLFSALPFALRSAYGAALAGAATGLSPAASPVTPRRIAQADDIPQPFKLQLNGAKTFGIAVDSRYETRTEQGLQLSLDGQLTESVMLTAAVSDRFSDRMSSGASAARLDDLDNFFVALTSPSLNARIGRVEFQSHTLTAGLARRLSGVELGVRKNGQTVSAAGGKLAGVVRRCEFFPQPGLAGPYPLTEQRRPVVTQSERVSLDGRLLERGIDRDYTIDYFSGEITFTPRVVLNERMRVSVTFEEGATTYDRRAVFTTWRSTAREGRLANEVGVQWEGDDPDGGFGFRLSPADRDTLARQTSGELRRDGAVDVGAGRGEYLAKDSLGERIYTYVGPRNGNYNVRFEYAGPGQGTYIHQGGGTYGFVGPGKGDFLPRVTVSAPGARLLVTNGFQLSETPIGSIEASAVGLALQPNRLNSRSQVSDWSHDLSWSSARDSAAAPGEQKLQLGARWRRLGRSEQVGGGIDQADVARQWFLPVGRYAANLQVIESWANLAPASALHASVQYGVLGGSGRGTRHAETVAATIIRSLTLQMDHQQSEASLHESDTVRGREVWAVVQRWGAWGGELFSGLRRETRTGAAVPTERFDTYELGLGVSGMRSGVTADRVYAGPGRADLVETRRRLWLDGLVSVRPLGFSGLLSASRISRHRVEGHRRYRDYLGQADLRWTLPQWGLAAIMNYSLNQYGVRNTIESFIPVAPGFGSYRREDSLLVNDPRGDLVRVTGSAGELHSAAVGRKEFTLRRGYTDHRAGWLRHFSDYSGELRAIREEAIDPEQISVTRWTIPWGTLGAARSGGTSLWVRRETSADLERRIATGKTPWFIRGQYMADDDRFGFSNAGHRRAAWELSTRGNRPRSTWSSWEIALARHERDLSGYSGAAAINALTHQVRVTVGWTLSSAVSASTQSAVERIHDRNGNGDALVWGAAPSVSVRFGRAGSLRAMADYDSVQSGWRTGWIPSGAGGYAVGHNVQCLLDGRIEVIGAISLRTHSTLDWFGRRRPVYRFDIQAVSTF